MLKVVARPRRPGSEFAFWMSSEVLRESSARPRLRRSSTIIWKPPVWPRPRMGGGITTKASASGIQEALAFVVIPPPIRGLGQTGGFQMMVEDRRSLGLTELSRNTVELMQKGNSNPGLRGLATTFSMRSPQVYLNIDRTKAESLQVLPQSIFDTLQAYLGSSFVNFFNKFNQVFQVYIQADNAYRLQAEDLRHLYVRNQNGGMVPLNALIQVRQVQGTELITRYNLYPAASIFGSAAPRSEEHTSELQSRGHL